METPEKQTNGFFIRFDIGPCSRYTDVIKGNITSKDGFFIFAYLHQTEEEVRELFNTYGLIRFQVCEMKDGNVIYHEVYGVPENDSQ